MVDVNLALAIIGGAAVLGYFAEYVFEKTRIPDAVFLILFGMIISFIGAIPSSGMLTLAPLLAAVAIVIMSFEFAMRLNFDSFVHGLPRASMLAVISIALTTVGVALVGYAALGLDIVRALLLGTIVGGIASSPLERLLNKIHIKDEFKEFIKGECVLSDTISFVAALLIINFYAIGSVGNPAQVVAQGVGIGIAVGLVIGILRLFGEGGIKGKPYNYILTMGLAFVAYVATEWMNGTGVLAAISYGLLLGNAKKLPRFMGKMREYVPSTFIKKFFSEISLFLRAFFLVLLGTMAIEMMTGGWIWGLAILAVIIILRIPAVELALIRRSITPNESWLLKGMLPRDLSSIVLVLFAISQGITGAESWLGIVFIVILGSVLYMSAVALLVRGEQQVITRKQTKMFSYEDIPKKKPKLWKRYGEQ